MLAQHSVRAGPPALLDRFLIPRRVFFYPIVPTLIMLAIFIYLVSTGHPPISRAGDPDGGDLTAKLTGGRIALSGGMRHLYDVDKQSAVQQALLSGRHLDYLSRFDSPPVAAYLFAPFAALPYLLGVALWAIFSITLLVVCIRLLWPLLPNLHRYGYKRILLLAFATMPAMRLLISGQDSVVALFLMIAGLRLLLARRDGLAGAVLGLGAFKPQSVLLVPLLLLLQRRWRALGAWVAVAVVLAAVSVALIGPAGVRSYIQFLSVESARDGATPTHGLAWRIPSLFGLAHVLGAFVPSLLADVILGLAVAAGVAILIWWGRSAARPAHNSGDFCVLYAGMVLAGALINPHLLDYDAIVLLLPALLLYNAAPESRRLHYLLFAAFVLAWSMALVTPFFMDDAPRALAWLGAPWVSLVIVGLLALAQSKLSEPRDRRSAAPALVGKSA